MDTAQLARHAQSSACHHSSPAHGDATSPGTDDLERRAQAGSARPEAAGHEAVPGGVVLGYPLMPWAMCPWCADSCSAWSSSELRRGLMSKMTFFTVPVNAKGALSA